MSVAYVSSITALPGPSGGSTGTINTTGATLLVISVSWGGGTTAFSDSKGNTWTVVPYYGVGPYHQYAYCLTPVVGSGHSFTVTTGGSGYPSIVVFAFSGTAGYAGAMYAGRGAFLSSPFIVPGTLTSTNPNSLIMLGLSDDATVPLGLGVVGYPFFVTETPGLPGVCYGGASGYYVQPSAGAVSGMGWTWTTGASYNLGATLLVFNAGVSSVTDAATSQLVMEILSGAEATEARSTQLVMEVLYGPTVVTPSSEQVQFLIL